MSYKDNLSYKMQTYSGPRLVSLQYEVIIENLEEMKTLIQDVNPDKDRINYLLDKNRDIFSNLMTSLDENTEFNTKTKALYVYFVKEIDKSLISKDIDNLNRIIALLKSTKDAWEKVANKIEKDTGDDNINVGATYSKDDINVFGGKNDWKA